MEPLTEVDRIMFGRARRLRDAEARAARETAAQQQFREDFDKLCIREIRPAMEAFVDRLRRDGGGGEVDVGHGPAVAHPRDPRITVWLSLDGEISGHPRPDIHPYLQLDGRCELKVVAVSEGDMWRGKGGGQSGPVDTWRLDEITSDRITRELVNVLRRAANGSVND